MTREAKIGMLTGLGVIVLVGVLLSEYLGTPAGTSSTTGRMAALPLGDAYRHDIMQPVGVPGTVRNDATVAGGTLASLPVQPVAAVPIAPGMNDVPKAYAAVNTGDNGVADQPVIGQPVAAVPAGQMQVAVADGKVPTLDLGDKTPDVGSTVYVAGQPALPAGAPGVSTVVAAAAAPKGDVYVIVAGDSLPKIAKKVYKSAKNSDIQRIVAANPAVLKNANTVLMVGKKLFIPAVVKAGAAAVTVTVQPSVNPVVITPPAVKSPAPTAAPTATSTPRIYVVKNGETLGGIAHELFPGSAAAMVKKIMAANGIKNANDIHVGDKLKIPAKV